MVTERAFHDQPFIRINVSFNDNICIFRNVQVVGKAFNQPDLFLSEESGKNVLIDIFRKGSSGRISINRIASQCYSHRHSAFFLFPGFKMFGTGFMPVPVHCRRTGIEDLYSVHSNISCAGLRIRSMDHGEGKKAPPVVRPAFQYREY